MRINSILKTALDPVAPAKADVYDGKKSVYIMINYNTVPGNYGDDEPEHECVLVQVHVYAPTGLNVLGKMRAVKKALSAAGMTWPGYVNASDKDGQHHIFECETLQEAGDG